MQYEEEQRQRMGRRGYDETDDTFTSEERTRDSGVHRGGWGFSSNPISGEDDVSYELEGAHSGEDLRMEAEVAEHSMSRASTRSSSYYRVVSPRSSSPVRMSSAATLLSPRLVSAVSAREIRSVSYPPPPHSSLTATAPAGREGREGGSGGTGGRRSRRSFSPLPPQLERAMMGTRSPPPMDVMYDPVDDDLMELETFLSPLGLLQLKEPLSREAINLKVMLDWEQPEEELKEIGITQRGIIFRLVKALKALQAEGSGRGSERGSNRQSYHIVEPARVAAALQELPKRAASAILPTQMTRSSDPYDKRRGPIDLSGEEEEEEERRAKQRVQQQRVQQQRAQRYSSEEEEPSAYISGEGHYVAISGEEVERELSIEISIDEEDKYVAVSGEEQHSVEISIEEEESEKEQKRSVSLSISASSEEVPIPIPQVEVLTPGRTKQGVLIPRLSLPLLKDQEDDRQLKEEERKQQLILQKQREQEQREQEQREQQQREREQEQRAREQREREQREQEQREQEQREREQREQEQREREIKPIIRNNQSTLPPTVQPPVWVPQPRLLKAEFQKDLPTVKTRKTSQQLLPPSKLSFRIGFVKAVLFPPPPSTVKWPVGITGRIDPYIICRSPSSPTLDEPFETEICDSTYEPNWAENGLVPITRVEVAMDGKVHIEIWDSNSWGDSKLAEVIWEWKYMTTLTEGGLWTTLRFEGQLVGELFLQISLDQTFTYIDWQPDYLGPDYEFFTLPLQSDYFGSVVATLIRRLVPEEKEDDAEPKRGVLFLPTFSDFFWHKDVAEHFVQKGINFYALDLRRYGRSLLHLQKANFVSKFEEHFEEINEAVRIIRLVDNVTDLLLYGQGTGGVTACLYANKYQDGINRVLLNSPVFNLSSHVPESLQNSSAFSKPSNRYEEVQAICEHYHQELAKEWKWPLFCKPIAGYPLYYGWLIALSQAHKSIAQEGLNIQIPLLVLCSSTNDGSDIPNMRPRQTLGMRDIITHKTHIIAMIPKIARMGKIQLVDRAVHDVFLSKEEVRTKAYEYLWEFLGI